MHKLASWHRQHSYATAHWQVCTCGPKMSLRAACCPHSSLCVFETPASHETTTHSSTALPALLLIRLLHISFILLLNDRLHCRKQKHFLYIRTNNNEWVITASTTFQSEEWQNSSTFLDSKKNFSRFFWTGTCNIMKNTGFWSLFLFWALKLQAPHCEHYYWRLCSTFINVCGQVLLTF